MKELFRMGCTTAKAKQAVIKNNFGYLLCWVLTR
jgi:hypothetical protein